MLIATEHDLFNLWQTLRAAASARCKPTHPNHAQAFIRLFFPTIVPRLSEAH